MEDTAFLDIGAEPNLDLVEIAAENRAGPDGGSVVDRDLSRQHHVGRHVGINGDLREPLPQRYYLPLTSVVPPNTIWRVPYAFRC